MPEDLCSKERFFRGEKWINREALLKWADVVRGMKKMRGFNSKGWTKREIKKRPSNVCVPERMMLIFIKKK